VADCPGDHVFLVLVVVFALLETADCLGDIARDRRLLRNYEGLGHGAGIELRWGIFASQSSLPARSTAR